MQIWSTWWGTRWRWRGQWPKVSFYSFIFSKLHWNIFLYYACPWRNFIMFYLSKLTFSYQNFRKYKLPASCIIPFPKWNDPSSTQEFPSGRNVLAVYPGTTALYKATVISTPRKVRILAITVINNHISIRITCSTSYSSVNLLKYHLYFLIYIELTTKLLVRIFGVQSTILYLSRGNQMSK